MFWVGLLVGLFIGSVMGLIWGAALAKGGGGDE